ncbi:hypothetical protein HYH02_008880 [Chlamydomonas schloesseri]|uniref:Uncharacterized protein n=1 Tax=Chlamydomonas schloesseri TaxID=2026947 RepID=A0A836B1M8_9CHLO|nr:hypothetical protein HYH02_008880 [Chlamydomonas schloesseri]|eukprot:KAG2445011.1 hypothetical protein HYH02_008880 [Chlamydomonas schloesseri]
MDEDAGAIFGLSVMGAASYCAGNASNLSVETMQSMRAAAEHHGSVLVRPGKQAGTICLVNGDTLDNKVCIVCLEDMPESDRWAVKHLGADDAHFGVHKACGEQLGGRCPACREPTSGLIDMKVGTRVFVTSNDADQPEPTSSALSL